MWAHNYIQTLEEYTYKLGWFVTFLLFLLYMYICLKTGLLNMKFLQMYQEKKYMCHIVTIFIYFRYSTLTSCLSV